MLDVFYMSYRFQSSFVAKKEEKRVFAFRTAGEAYDAIWVDRSSQSEKENVIQQIQDRVKEYLGSEGHPANPRRIGPLLIFPEGTTSNGEKILSMKQGAFVPLSPLKIACLDYRQSNYSNFLDEEGAAINMLFTMCQVYNSLKVTQIDCLDPVHLVNPNDPPELQVSQFMSATQQFMADVLQIGVSNKGYSHSQVYSMLYKHKFRISTEEAQRRVNERYQSKQ